MIPYQSATTEGEQHKNLLAKGLANYIRQGPYVPQSMIP